MLASVEFQAILIPRPILVEWVRNGMETGPPTYLTLPFDEHLPILAAVSDPWVPLLLLTLGSETFVPCNLI